jgi:uncharacterized protein (DUF1697 family)
MTRYVAFLRGVSPSNARMPDLKHAFEAAGFTAVRTLLASGNVLFESKKQPVPSLERRAVAGMKSVLGRAFGTIVWAIEDLDKVISSDPFAEFKLPTEAKRVVTFLRERPEVHALPIEKLGARILAVKGKIAFSAYVPHPGGPVFMTLIESTFGADVTTRTWNTVSKCVKAGKA